MRHFGWWLLRLCCHMQVPEDGDGTPAKAAPRAAFKFNSVGSQFKKQLGELMSQLLTMEPHYVRCVKPNGLNQPGLFENTNALHQLRCGGAVLISSTLPVPAGASLSGCVAFLWGACMQLATGAITSMLQPPVLRPKPCPAHTAHGVCGCRVQVCWRLCASAVLASPASGRSPTLWTTSGHWLLSCTTGRTWTTGAGSKSACRGCQSSASLHVHPAKMHAHAAAMLPAKSVAEALQHMLWVVLDLHAMCDVVLAGKSRRAS